MKHKDLRPWLSVIAGGESLVSHAGGVLLVETELPNGAAAGTAMVLDSSGLALTNYHVVHGSTTIRATVASSLTDIAGHWDTNGSIFGCWPVRHWH